MRNPVSAGLKLTHYPISDVPGDRSDLIASGPTIRDSDSLEEAITLLESQAPKDAFAAEVAAMRDYYETVKQLASNEAQEHFATIATNATAITAAAQTAQLETHHDVQLEVHVFAADMRGEASAWGASFAALGMALAEGRLPDETPGFTPPIRVPRRPFCLIAGGETTVKIADKAGKGHGGRTLELVLGAAMEMASERGGTEILVAITTDGEDGNSLSGGAVATTRTVYECGGKELVRKSLAAHNTAPLLGGIRDLIRHGPTGTNVNDIVVFVAP